LITIRDSSGREILDSYGTQLSGLGNIRGL
jgi:hypothetical protein